MNFANPERLWLLALVLPGLVLFFWWSWRKSESLMSRFIQTRLLPGLVSGISPVRRKIRYGCLIVAAAAAIVALARPLGGLTLEQVKQRGLDIVIAIDTSRSMLATDIAPNRLARAKLAALDLMQQAKSDRLGLVAFAGNAFLQCPLTIDDTAFRQSLDMLDVSLIPQGGTAIAEAIRVAQTAFKETDNHKVIVLMSDGEDQDSGALEEAGKAATNGVRIYAIGIGTETGDLMPLKDAQGHPDYVRDAQNNVVKSHLEEGLLRDLANETDGIYLRLSGAKTIETLFNAPQGLASLPKSDHQEKTIKQYRERFHWWLELALLALLTEMLLPERRRDAKPAQASATELNETATRHAAGV
jgi:Ca-activated chloride channel homolog